MTLHSAHSVHRERVLQDHLIDRLVTGEGYERRDPATDYDRALAMDKALVLSFARETQPDEWAEELCAEVGDGLTGRRRRIVGVFEPPLLQQRSDTPCPMLTSSSCFSQGRSATRSPRCCAMGRAPYWPKRSRPRWRNSSPSMSI